MTDSIFPCPVLIELFGHGRLAGIASLDETFGEAMLRVDVPQQGTTPAYTRMVHPNAIYSITFVSTDIMLANVEYNSPPTPISYDQRKLIERLQEEVMRLRNLQLPLSIPAAPTLKVPAGDTGPYPGEGADWGHFPDDDPEHPDDPDETPPYDDLLLTQG